MTIPEAGGGTAVTALAKVQMTTMQQALFLERMAVLFANVMTPDAEELRRAFIRASYEILGYTVPAELESLLTGN